MIVGRLVVILLLVMSFYASGGTPVPTKVSFSLPFTALWSDLGGSRPDWAGRIALSNSFDSRLKVAIISKWRVCRAKTGRQFRYSEPGHEVTGSSGFGATLLEETENCPIGGGEIAVIGVDPMAIRLVTTREGSSTVPKRLVLKARQLLGPEFGTAGERWLISDAPPKATRAGRTTLVQFRLVVPVPGQESNVFCSALILHGRIFPLEGRCTYGHIFFTVNRKLHLAYWNVACGWGWQVMTVYDLSNGSPKKIHEIEDPFNDV